MNNEEKILSILETLSDKVETLSDKVDNIESDMKDVKERLTNVESKLTVVDERLTGLEDKVLMTNMTIESEIEPGIRLLSEGHKILVDRLWHLPDEVEDIKESVSILDFVQKQMGKKQVEQSKKLKQIKQVK